MCFLLTAPPQLTFAVAVDFNRASNSGFHVSHTQNQSHCPSLETPARGSWCALLRGLASISVSSPTLSPLFFQPRRPELLPELSLGNLSIPHLPLGSLIPGEQLTPHPIICQHLLACKVHMYVLYMYVHMYLYLDMYISGFHRKL